MAGLNQTLLAINCTIVSAPLQEQFSPFLLACDGGWLSALSPLLECVKKYTISGSLCRAATAAFSKRENMKEIDP